MVFLNITEYKGNLSKKEKKEKKEILCFETYIKVTNTIQYLHPTCAHDPLDFKDFMKENFFVMSKRDSAKLENILYGFNINVKNRGFQSF